jgi:hypothetical protein
VHHRVHIVVSFILPASSNQISIISLIIYAGGSFFNFSKWSGDDRWYCIEVSVWTNSLSQQDQKRATFNFDIQILNSCYKADFRNSSADSKLQAIRQSAKEKTLQQRRLFQNAISPHKVDEIIEVHYRSRPWTNTHTSLSTSRSWREQGKSSRKKLLFQNPIPSVKGKLYWLFVGFAYWEDDEDRVDIRRAQQSHPTK